MHGTAALMLHARACFYYDGRVDEGCRKPGCRVVGSLLVKSCSVPTKKNALDTVVSAENNENIHATGTGLPCQ